jgi:hypothetical protein
MSLVLQDVTLRRWESGRQHFKVRLPQEAGIPFFCLPVVSYK